MNLDTRSAGANGGTGNVDGNLHGNSRGKRRIWRRKPWENASTAVIGAGILMLMQPFALELYTYSFVVTLAGTLGFLISSHFPE